MSRSIIVMLTACMFIGSGNLLGQVAFSSGSSAAQGAFPPAAFSGLTYNTLTVNLVTAVVTATTGTTVVSTATMPGAAVTGDAFPTGDLDFTTFTVPAGVTLKFGSNTLNTPVTIRTTGDVTINGTIYIQGGDGRGGLISFAGRGNIGGNDGGRGGNAASAVTGYSDGSPGLGRNGGAGGVSSAGFTSAAAVGSGGKFPHTNSNLIPLVGGSGGGGGRGGIGDIDLAGGGGGGGGGAILIASSTRIAISGSIKASGGAGGVYSGGGSSDATGAGGGSGGAIRLISNRIEMSGNLEAKGGIGFAVFTNSPNGGAGIIRLEANDLDISGSATASPALSAGLPGIVRPVNLPRLRITSIGGVSIPDTPSGVTGTVDAQSSSGTNPMAIVVTGSNIPNGTTVTVSIKTGEIPETTATGTTATVNGIPTATISMTVPTGVSYIQAFTAAFTASAELQRDLPLFNGEKILKAAVEFDGMRDHTYFYTTSGKRVSAEMLLGSR